MTQYVPHYSTWNAIMYDGTNEADIAAAIAPLGGVIWTNPAGAKLIILGSTEIVGSLHASYSNWVLYVDRGSGSSGPRLKDGEKAVYVAYHNDDNTAPDANWMPAP